MDAVELGRCFDAHAATLALYARQWLDAAGAEDVVQDAFVQLMAQRVRPANAKAWLYRTVRNAAISAARSRRRRQEREQTIARRRSGWFVSRPEDKIDAQRAQAMLEQLAPEQREAVVLRIWGQMTLAEASAVMGMPVSSLHDLYRQALSLMRSRMELPCHRDL